MSDTGQLRVAIIIVLLASGVANVCTAYHLLQTQEEVLQLVKWQSRLLDFTNVLADRVIALERRAQ